MKKRLLLLDFNNLLFRSVFGHQGLTHKGHFTGGLYGFIDMVTSAVLRYDCNRVVVCTDNKPYLRSNFYPKYKADRVSSLGPEAQEQVAVARSQITAFIRKFRFPFAMCLGHEADDLIGEYCSDSSIYKNIMIMSNDSDLYQLLDGRTFLVKTGGLYGIADFRKDWPDITPSQWPSCVALKGGHNGVDGINGVGDKIAYKAIANGMSPNQINKKWGMKPKAFKLRQALATFPLPLVKRPQVPAVRKIKYDPAVFDNVCDRYGIKFTDEFNEALLRLAT